MASLMLNYSIVKSLNSILEAPQLVRQARLPPSSYVYFHWRRRPTPRHLAAAALTTTATRYSAPPQVDLQSSTGIPTAANGNSVIIPTRKARQRPPPIPQNKMAFCSAVTLCFASIFSLVAAALLAISFSTDNWRVITINRDAIKVRKDQNSRLDMFFHSIE